MIQLPHRFCHSLSIISGFFLNTFRTLRCTFISSNLLNLFKYLNSPSLSEILEITPSHHFLGTLSNLTYNFSLTLVWITRYLLYQPSLTLQPRPSLDKTSKGYKKYSVTEFLHNYVFEKQMDFFHQPFANLLSLHLVI